MRTIAISLSPNTEKDDVLLAIRGLLQPINWYNLEEIRKLESKFSQYFGKQYYALAINSARSAEYLILKSLNIAEGDSVAVQALTCVAVPNSILWLKATPIFIDVDATYNISPQDLESKITKTTKAIIVQHTFGIPAKMDKLIKIANKHRLVLIEDCAVSLGAKFKNHYVGTLGKVSFFSFGRDKVVSSVFGGMILTSDKVLYGKLLIARDSLDWPSWRWTFQQLLHPILMKAIIPFYFFGYKKVTIGKVFLFMFQKLKILSKAVYEIEKYSGKPPFFPAKMPGVMAKLANHQFSKLNRFNIRRQEIAAKYFKELDREKFTLPPFDKGSIWLRVPVQVKDPISLIEYCKKKKILLGDWYRKPVVPSTYLSNLRYYQGSCPNAESISKHIVNLPTNPTLNDGQINYIINQLNKWES